MLAEQLPLPFVLQAEHHGAAIANREWTVWIDRGVRCTGARRWRGSFVGVVERVIHPLHQALKHRNFNVAADAGFSRNNTAERTPV